MNRVPDSKAYVAAGAVGLLVVGIALVWAQPEDRAVEVASEGPQELVVSLGHTSTFDEASVFAQAEELWDDGKHAQAAKEYRKVVQGTDVSGMEAKAQRKIGLYYVTTGDWDRAEAAFKKALSEYAPDENTGAWTRYDLARLDIQRREFRSAISKFQAIIDKGGAEDEEVYAYAYSQMARVYVNFLHDTPKAEGILHKVLERYPDSVPARHRLWME